MREAPEGWVQVGLAEVTVPSPSRVKPESSDDDVYVGLEHVQSDTGRVVGQGRAGDTKSAKTPFSAGDVLYGRLRPYLNKVAVAAADGVCSTEIYVFPASQFLDSRWLAHFLRRRETVEYATMHSSGTQLPRIRFESLGLLEIPLPPLAEQKRIVARLDKCLGTARQARESVDSAAALLRSFPEIVSESAASGALTRDWRNKATTGDALFDEIKIRPAGAQHSTRKSGETPAEASRPAPELPAGWAWAALEDLLNSERAAAYGILQPGNHQDGGIQMVRVQDIDSGTVATEGLKRVAPEIEAPYGRTRLDGGEVLVTLVGTVGRSAVAPSALQGANVARAVAVLPLDPRIEPEFVRLCLSTHDTRQFMETLAREVARKTLNLGLLKGVQVPLPSYAEQREIRVRVGRLVSMVHEAAAAVASVRSLLARTEQALLNSAFSGHLVPTEVELARREGRAYEPASVLLERTRAAREKGLRQISGRARGSLV